MTRNAALLTLVFGVAACKCEPEESAAPAAQPAEKTIAAPAAQPAESPAAAPAEKPPAPAPAAAPAAAAMKLEKTTPSASYPLKTCIVSGEELGDDRLAYKWGDTEVQFCCPECPPKFEKEPEKYLAKLHAVK